MKTEKLQWLWKEIAVWIQLVREQHHNKSNFDGIKSPFLFREIVLHGQFLTLGSLVLEDSLHLMLGTYFGENIDQILNESLIRKI